MNTERRHELHENTLARELNTWGDRVRPYTSLILSGVAVLLALYIALQMWNSYQDTRDQAAWDDYQLALFQGDIEQKALQRLANSEDHAGTEMQEWALMGWADRQLRRASDLYLSNRTEANNRLTDIIGVYEQMAENSASSEISNRARLGLARAYEMKNDLAEAKKHYQRVGGALADIADRRLRELDSKGAEDATKWLATVELPTPTPPGGPGTPGSRPGFEATTPPADPPGGAPSTIEDILGGLGEDGDSKRYGEGAPAEGAAAPSGDATAPASDTPADASTGGEGAAKSGESPAEPPATETPAAASTAPAPTAETPAAEAPADAGDDADEAAAPAEQPAAADASAPK